MQLTVNKQKRWKYEEIGAYSKFGLYAPNEISGFDTGYELIRYDKSSYRGMVSFERSVYWFMDSLKK